MSAHCLERCQAIHREFRTIASESANALNTTITAVASAAIRTRLVVGSAQTRIQQAPVKSEPKACADMRYGIGPM